MRLAFILYYGGPDQIMVVTSGLASLVGLLLMFWNKVVTTFFRIVRVFRPAPPETASAARGNDVEPGSRRH